jgi:ankyrin repeat protein
VVHVTGVPPNVSICGVGRGAAVVAGHACMRQMQAAQNGHVRAVAVLLDRCGNTCATKLDQVSALHIAVQNEHLELVEMLIARKVSGARMVLPVVPMLNCFLADVDQGMVSQLFGWSSPLVLAGCMVYMHGLHAWGETVTALLFDL